jgi:hypothetical protein
MKKAIKLASATALVLSFGVAHAQNNTAEKFYGGLEVGRSNVANQTGAVTSLLVSQLGGSASATQGASITDYRIFSGYKLNENLNFELGYLQTSSLGLNFSGVTRGSAAYTGSVSVKYSGFDYSVLLRPDVSTGMNNLFFRVGGHSLKGDSTVTATGAGGTASGSTSQSGAGVLYGIGYDVNIGKNFDIRASLNRLNKIAGESGGNATIYSVGVLTRF